MFQGDIDKNIKNLPHINLIPLYKSLFYQKWKDRGEEAAVEAWSASWNNALISRVEMNRSSVCPLMGGIPSDNNALEASNNTDKNMLMRQKSHVTALVDVFADKVIRPISAADVRYQGRLKTRSNHKEGKNTAVLNQNFFRFCYKIMKKDGGYGSLMFDLTWEFTSSRLGLSAGTFLVTSHKAYTRALADTDFEFNGKEPAIRDFKRYFVTENGTVAWFKELVRKGEAILDEPYGENESQWKNFRTVSRVLGTFHIMKPVLGCADENSVDNDAIKNWVDLMDYSGIPTISAEEIIARNKTDGLLACSCKQYMQYLLCHHTFCFAMQRGIITGWPGGKLDPTPMVRLSKKRKTRMHGGDALNRNG